jgi:hypothetical protein
MCSKCVEKGMTDESRCPSDGPDVFPSEEELPDDPVSVDDIDPFIVDDDGFKDINNFALAELLARTAQDAELFARATQNEAEDE